MESLGSLEEIVLMIRYPNPPLQAKNNQTIILYQSFDGNFSG